MKNKEHEAEHAAWASFLLQAGINNLPVEPPECIAKMPFALMDKAIQDFGVETMIKAAKKVVTHVFPEMSTNWLLEMLDSLLDIRNKHEEMHKQHMREQN